MNIPIVALIGPTTYAAAYQRASAALTQSGSLALLPAVMDGSETPELQRQRIDLASHVVLIGGVTLADEATLRALAYAQEQDKTVGEWVEGIPEEVDTDEDKTSDVLPGTPLLFDDLAPAEPQVIRHPAFGHLALTPVQSRGQKLFEAGTGGQLYRLTVSRAKVREMAAGQRRVRPAAPLVSVMMTAAQWHALLGLGQVSEPTPCTIEQVGGETVPPVPDDHHEDPAARAEREVRKAAGAVLERAAEVSTALSATLAATSTRAKNLTLPRAEAAQLRDRFDEVASALRDLPDMVNRALDS